MRSVSVRLEDLKTMILNLGFAGENEHTRVTVDCKKMYDQYPHASASMTVQPPEGEAYPAVIERDGDYVIWDVTDSDLIAEGSGELQLSFTQEPHLAKSYTGRFKVGRSIIPTGEVPEPLDDFLTRAGAAVTGIPETINSALAAAKASGEFDGPQGPAGQDGADGQDGFSPVVEVSAITGGHRVSVTDAEGTETFDVMDGVDGQDGTDGNDGVTPEISIGTVAKGTDPAASMDNTDPAHPVLSLTLPKGDKGDKGYTGYPTDAQVATAISAVVTNPDSPPLDRTLSSNVSAAPADMVGDLKSAVDNFKGDCGYAPIQLQMGKSIVNNTSSAVIIPSSITNENGFCCLCIPCQKGDIYSVTGTGGSSTRLWAFSNANGVRIDGSLGNASATDLVLTAPEGSAYFSFNSKTNNGIVYSVYSGKKPIRRFEEFDGRIDNLEDIMTPVPVPQDVPSTDITLHDNHYMGSNGTESAEYNVWQYAEYTLPDGVASIRVTGAAGQSAPLWLLENTTGTVLGYSSDSSSVSTKTETVSLATYTGAKKLFVNDKKSGALAIVLIYNGEGVDGDAVYIDGQSLPDVLDEISPKRSDKLYGKILCCVGDSITYGADMDSDGITNTSRITVYNCNDSGVFSQTLSGFRKTWGWQIANRHDMTFYNGGVSGSTMQNVTGHAGFSAADGRYTKLPDTLDYLLIWFGWNDNAYGTLGTIADDDNDSYYGGYNVVLPYLLNKYTYAKIGLIVPFGASAGHREAIRLLGNKWGVAVFDNYQGGTPLYYGKEDSVGVEASVVTANHTKFQANGAHPNYKGHTQLADMIEEWLKGI